MTRSSSGSFIARIIVAGVLSFTVIGCGHTSGHHHHGGGHTHHGGGGDVVSLIANGLILGAQIADAASRSSSPPREPVYIESSPSTVYYVESPPPAPPPPSPPAVIQRNPRDDVPENRPDELPPFDPQAARAALNAIDVSGCREAGAPKGFGHAKVTFNPDGRASKVVVDEPSGLEADAATCIGDRMGTARVAPFRGSLITMGTTYRVL